MKFMGVAEDLGWDHLTMTSPCPCRCTASQLSTWLHFRFESVGIHMTLSIGIPFEFSTDRRGMPAKGLGNVLLRTAFSPSLPDIKSFFMTYLLIAFHLCCSSSQWIGCSHYRTRVGRREKLHLLYESAITLHHYEKG